MLFEPLKTAELMLGLRVMIVPWSIWKSAAPAQLKFLTMMLPLMLLPDELPLNETAALGAMIATPLVARSASNCGLFGTGVIVRLPLKLSESSVEALVAIT